MDPAHNSSEHQFSPPSQPSGNLEDIQNMSSTPTRTSNGDLPSNGSSQAADANQPPKERGDPFAEQVQNVATSDIGINIFLTRLKQSVLSAKEFALFLQKRSRLEEEQASGLRKISRATHENLRRPEHRQGSFIASYDEITRIHERMADNGSQFAQSLHQMHDDLSELAANIERGRKQWKQTGLAAEQRLVDAETVMRKAKAKYDALAEDYDRARTGDRQTTKKFGLKGPKSAAQHEEELLRKVQAADADYAAKVQAAQATKQEHLQRGRPEAVKNLQDMIKECDSALTMQMQNFASFNEKLLVSNGMSVSPLKGEPAASDKNGRSLRDAIADINNDGDLSYYVASHSSQVVPKPEIRYERNPVLAPAAPVVVSQQQRKSEPPQSMGSFASRQGPTGGPSGSTPPNHSPMGSGPSFSSGPPPAVQQQPQFQHERSFSQPPNQPPPQSYGSQDMGRHGPSSSVSQSQTSYSSGGPPQLQTLPFQDSTPLSQSFDGPPAVSQPPKQQPPAPYGGPQQPQERMQQQSPAPYGGTQQPQERMRQQIMHQPQSSQSWGRDGREQSPYAPRPDPATLPPLKPVFGMTLDALFERDGSAVPMVVYQCIQAVDLFGLEVEGIYRLSGTGSHVTKIRAMFDNDASKLDFRDPAAFFHDVNSVAGLLKQFFRDLPDPLLTLEHYAAFVEASKAEDDTVRRDSLHAIINSLPDSNYATLRAITLHLHRVMEKSSVNRMNSSNLAIVWGPTLMGAGTGGKIQDAGWQVKVVQTILESCYQIFDDD